MAKWPLVRLGDVCEINPPKQQILNMFEGKEVSFVPMSSVDEIGNINVSDIRPFSDVSNGYSYFIENDVLFAKITPCMENGKGAIARGLKNGVGAGSTEFHILRADVEKITSEWIYRFLSLPMIRKFAEINMTGSAGQKRVPKTFLENLKIPLPPIDIQKNIANIFDKTQEIIDGHKKQLAELDNLIMSVFYEMFGDPAANEKEWEVKSLKEISEKPLSYGSGASATDYNGDVRYIRITDINDDGSLNRDVVSPNVIDTKYILNDGDILFARSGATVGKTLRFRESFGKCIYAGYLIRFVPKEKFVLPDYVYYYTKTNLYRRFIGSNIKTVAQPNINARQYGELKVVIPPLDLQNKFAEIVTKIDEQKALVKRAITESEHLFNSLMSEYFD